MDALTQLMSVRHYCFHRGVLGNQKKGHNEAPEQDFREAFRTLNRLYVQMRDKTEPKPIKGANRRSERGARG